MTWQERCRDKIVSADKAVEAVKSGDRVIVNIGGEPRHCLQALARRADQLRNVKLATSWVYDYPWFHPGLQDAFDVRATFTSRVTRDALREGRVDWIPWIPGLGARDRSLQKGRGCVQEHADVAFVMLTPPDDKGYCSFGNQTWNGPTAVRTSKTVIAGVDQKMPFTFGDNVHISQIDYLVEIPEDIESITFPASEWDTDNVAEWEQSQVIGAAAADLVRDGDTLQIGLGVPSEAIMNFLEARNDLGIDTEIIYPPIIQLIKNGVVTGERKNVNRGKVIASSCFIFQGHPEAKETVEFLDHNSLFEFRDFPYICNIPRIASNDNVVAVNTILAIDLLGQVSVHFLGSFPIGGVGGQLEYCIGSHYSRGGRSIACLLSTAKGETISRVVPQFEPGTGIDIPMGYADYLVTEHGVVNLEYKSRRERAEAIISVAHPDFRSELMKAAKRLFWP